MEQGLKSSPRLLLNDLLSAQYAVSSVSTELELVGRRTGRHAFHAVQEVGCASVMAASIIGTGNINNELTDTKEFTAKNKMVGYQSAETKLQWSSKRTLNSVRAFASVIDR